MPTNTPFKFGDPVQHKEYGDCMFIAYLNEYQCQIAGYTQDRVPDRIGSCRQINPIVPIVTITAGGKRGMAVSTSRHA